MAEAYFARLCRNAGRGDIEALSAGTSAWAGMPASEPAIAAMAGIGVDLTAFRSTRLTPELIDSVELIVAMSASHRRAVLALVPEAADKTRLLLGCADVPDPFGGSVADYRTVFAAMQPALDRLAGELLRTA